MKAVHRSLQRGFEAIVAIVLYWLIRLLSLLRWRGTRTHREHEHEQQLPSSRDEGLRRARLHQQLDLYTAGTSYLFLNSWLV